MINVKYSVHRKNSPPGVKAEIVREDGRRFAHAITVSRRELDELKDADIIKRLAPLFDEWVSSLREDGKLPA